MTPASWEETGWIRAPMACRDGCKLADARKMLAQAERLVGRSREGKPVSQALWCDQGNHPFSARDPKAEHWERQVKNDAGETITVPWDVCGRCMGGINQRLATMEQEIAAQQQQPAAAPAVLPPAAQPQWTPGSQFGGASDG